jgi:hypothetical protein
MANKQTIYISGAITGLAEHRVSQKFNEAEDKLKRDGYSKIYNPVTIGNDLDIYHIQNEKHKPTWAEYMEQDLIHLFNSDIVCALNCWRTSEGSTLELLIAKKLGKKIINLDGTEFNTSFEIKKH